MPHHATPETPFTQGNRVSITITAYCSLFLAVGVLRTAPSNFQSGAKSTTCRFSPTLQGRDVFSRKIYCYLDMWHQFEEHYNNWVITIRHKFVRKMPQNYGGPGIILNHRLNRKPIPVEMFIHSNISLFLVS
jgi:hypothetical protein